MTVLFVVGLTLVAAAAIAVSEGRPFAVLFGCGYYGSATITGREYIEITGCRCVLRLHHAGPHRAERPFVFRAEASTYD